MRLSETERMIVSYTLSGLTDKEVAQEVGLALHTVRTYWKRMKHKLYVDSRAEILGMWMRGELGQVDDRQVDFTWAVVEMAPDPIVLTNEAGVVRKINAAGRDLVGRSNEELVGRAFHDLVEPSKRKEVAQVWNQLADGVSVRDVFPVARPDGGLIPTEWHARRDERAKVITLVGRVAFKQS